MTKTKAQNIKTDLTNGMTQPMVAKKHKVSRSLVSDIATGRCHKDVPAAGHTEVRPG
jgi:predicted XRE-type DNA-binding protein